MAFPFCYRKSHEECRTLNPQSDGDRNAKQDEKLAGRQKANKRDQRNVRLGTWRQGLLTLRALQWQSLRPGPNKILFLLARCHLEMQMAVA